MKAIFLLSSVAADFGVWMRDQYCIKDQYLISVQYSYYQGYSQEMCENFCNDSMMAGMATRTYDGRNSFCCSYVGLPDGNAQCELYEGYDTGKVGIQDRQLANAAFTFGVYELEDSAKRVM